MNLFGLGKHRHSRKGQQQEAGHPATARVSVPRGPKGSGLLRLVGWPMLASILAVALMAGALYQVLLVQEHEQTLQRFGGIYVRQFNQVVSVYMHEAELLQDRLATHDAQALALLTQHSPPEALQAQEVALAASMPYVQSLRIVPADFATSGQGDYQLSYSMQDLAATTLADGRPRTEISYLNGMLVMNLTRRLTPGTDQPGGAIIATIDMRPLRDALRGIDADAGFFSLQQQLPPDKDWHEVLNQGNSQWQQGEPLAEMVMGNNQWRIRFWASPALTDNGPLSLLIIKILAAGLLLLITGQAVAQWRTEQVLHDESTRLLTFSQSLFATSMAISQRFTLPLFDHLAEDLKRLYLESRPRSGAGGKDSGPTLADDDDLALSDPLFTHVGVSLSEADESALEGLAPDVREQAQAALARADEATAPTAAQAGHAQEGYSPEGYDAPQALFAGYDIRGNAALGLNVEFAQHLGRALGSEVMARGENSVLLARDARKTSPELTQGLSAGLRASGVDVIDLGQVPIGVLYHATQHLPARTGVMVTGSHNPPGDNGFKIVLSGLPASEEEMSGLRRRMREERYSTGKGRATQVDHASAYRDAIRQDVVMGRPMRVVIDAGNGVAGLVAQQVLTALGVNVIPLFCEPDPSFPNHHPDPADPENLNDLASAVFSNEAELGLAFDGDGDRLGIITASGKVIWPDRTLMLFSRQLLLTQPGSSVVFDVKCSRELPSYIGAQGGTPVMWQSGHLRIKQKMRELNAMLGGEFTGHFYFRDRWHGLDDAIYAAARLLELLSMENARADDVFATLPELHGTAEISVPVAAPGSFMEKFSRTVFDNGSINTVDGVRVDFPEGWGLLRASHTSSRLTARFEARNDEDLQKIQKLFRERIRAVDATVDVPF